MGKAHKNHPLIDHWGVLGPGRRGSFYRHGPGGGGEKMNGKRGPSGWVQDMMEGVNSKSANLARQTDGWSLAAPENWPQPPPGDVFSR